MSRSRIVNAAVFGVVLILAGLSVHAVHAQEKELQPHEQEELDALCTKYAGKAYGPIGDPNVPQHWLTCDTIEYMFRTVSHYFYWRVDLLINACARVYEKGYTEDQKYLVFSSVLDTHNFHCQDKVGDTYRCFINVMPAWVKYGDFTFSKYGFERAKITTTIQHILFQLYNERRHGNDRFTINDEWVELVERLLAFRFIERNVHFAYFEKEDEHLVFHCKGKARSFD